MDREARELPDKLAEDENFLSYFWFSLVRFMEVVCERKKYDENRGDLFEQREVIKEEVIDALEKTGSGKFLVVHKGFRSYRLKAALLRGLFWEDLLGHTGIGVVHGDNIHDIGGLFDEKVYGAVFLVREEEAEPYRRFHHWNIFLEPAHAAAALKEMGIGRDNDSVAYTALLEVEEGQACASLDDAKAAYTARVIEWAKLPLPMQPTQPQRAEYLQRLWPPLSKEAARKLDMELTPESMRVAGRRPRG